MGLLGLRAFTVFSARVYVRAGYTLGNGLSILSQKIISEKDHENASVPYIYGLHKYLYILPSVVYIEVYLFDHA